MRFSRTLCVLTCMAVIGLIAFAPLHVAVGAESLPAECESPKDAWIWCDDFEEDRLAGYFEIGRDQGDFARVANIGVGESFGMRQIWKVGQVSGGGLKLAFGKTAEPYVKPVDDGETKYREIYYRFYLRHEDNWEGGGAAKLARATSLLDGWRQAMIAHIWSGGGKEPNDVYLVLDPASGTDLQGRLRTTKYNDFDNLRWLGVSRGQTPLFDADHVGEWYCIETYVKLNDPGEYNGEQRFWINDQLEAEKIGMNWLGDFDEYGINAIFLENYWNSGSPKVQERYFDNFVVSTERIGCL